MSVHIIHVAQSPLSAPAIYAVAAALVGFLLIIAAVARIGGRYGTRQPPAHRASWSTRLGRNPHSRRWPRHGLAHLAAIGRVGFERVPLLNGEESRFLPALEAAARDAGAGHRVMAQTSLGEIIRPTAGSASARAEAFHSINAKRLDFAIFDPAGRLVLAVEYQGTGHYQGDAHLRDRVKREAVEKAGARLLEIFPTDDPAAVRAQVAALLNPDAAWLRQRFPDRPPPR